MSKIYLSRSISRTMSADHPVGDPTGGAAYGEKNDPVSAAFAIYGMSASYGAMMTGSIMAGVTFAGSALSLVGNVTGNKTLSKIGMVAGIVGGLGQMGAFGEGVKGAKWGDSFSSTVDDSAVNYTSADANKGTTSLKGSPVKDGSLTDKMASKADYANAQKVADSNVAAGVQTKGVGGQPLGYGQTSTTPVAQTNAATVTAQTSGTSGLPNSGSAYTGTYTPPNMSVATMDAGYGSQPGFFSQAWEGTKELASGLNPITNPYGAMAVGQIAAPIADYLSGKTDAEIAALEAQTGYADASALRMQEEIAREKRRRENLNAGYAQVDTGINVNPNANIAQQGLIAQQLQQA